MDDFCLEFIPKIEDIPKTQETYWKNTTSKKLKYGDHFGPAKPNVYKDQGSNFILCHNTKSNLEYICSLQQDGKNESGKYRMRYEDGDTVIGSRYFRKSGSEKSRLVRLYRYNKSGNIHYYDEIWGKDGSGWREQAKYSFNPETLNWKKINV